MGKKSNKDNYNFFHLRDAFGLSPILQITVISLLFVIMTLVGYQQYKLAGVMFGYPLSISLLFVPIYEELIFRGFILGEFLKLYSERKAIVLSCLLFSLWHLKNIFWLSVPDLLFQLLFAGLVFGPIATYITIKKKTLWPAVILHYLNNLLAGINLLPFILNLFH